MKLGIICGGPSAERGISLNSARSLLDHLSQPGLEIVPLYVDSTKHFHRLAPAQLYSNTPQDFDFKLDYTKAVAHTGDLKQAFAGLDMVFPAMHGAFGEDGEVQTLLEQHGIPYVGSPATACARMFHKPAAQNELERLGFATLPFLLAAEKDSDTPERLERFFQTHKLQRAVVKPAAGGSSIGVFSVTSAQQALAAAQSIWERGLCDEVLVEPFCQGREFTVLVLAGENNQPVALVPTEIEMDYGSGNVFDFRRKYLPSTLVRYHCPPRFPQQVTSAIRAGAQQIFTHFGVRDFLRVDGWWLDDGRILFSDINPISGMEQNSFIFQQSAWLGYTQRQVLNHLCGLAAKRSNMAWPAQNTNKGNRQPVRVLMGGDTAERQVSLLSGTNAWLKLQESETYAPSAWFLDGQRKAWPLPRALCLTHTTEEISANLLRIPEITNALKPYQSEIEAALGLKAAEWPLAAPSPVSVEAFAKSCAEEGAYLLIGLHGGFGENGELQDLLTRHGVPFNGSGAGAARLCGDKAATAKVVEALNDTMLQTVPKQAVEVTGWYGHNPNQWEAEWKNLTQKLGTPVLAKPQADGCSAGVVVLTNATELARYVQAYQQREAYIPSGVFSQQAGLVEMPTGGDTRVLFETFIVTDRLTFSGHQLQRQERSGWVEMTVGVLVENGRAHAFNPSITVAAGETLTVEEKFQGGTGINLTPPPPTLMDAEALAQAKKSAEKAALVLGVENYVRLDIFTRLKDGKTYLIEANALPALTPSTVLYHQALAEPAPMLPRSLLEHLVSASRAPRQQGAEKAA